MVRYREFFVAEKSSQLAVRGGITKMKVIKNINNNVSLCIDSQNREVVAFGKGIGFARPPYEIELSRIERSFYDVDEAYIAMLKDIPAEILELSARVLDYAREMLDGPVSSNLVFTLADHIQFAVKRNEENLRVKLPILYDVEHLFEKETKIGYRALALIQKKLKIYLPKEEAACIALHILNAEGMNSEGGRTARDEKIIEEITERIERFFGLQIDRSGFNYSRFVMHMRYLLQRGEKKELFYSEDRSLYESVTGALPETKQCVEAISAYLQRECGLELTDEERMYLILHTNRLCDREDQDSLS